MMLVKIGQLPPPTWENQLMAVFPKDVHWDVVQRPEGFTASVRGFAAPYMFPEWQEGLLWVARQLGVTEEQILDFRAGTAGQRRH